MEKEMHEEKPKSIKKNYLFNLTYQVFLIIVPLIVTPYVSRVFGEEGIGQYAFSYAICSYFMIFAALGFNKYAQRAIAKSLGNKEKQSKVFWEIMFIRAIATTISLGCYLILIMTNLFSDYNLLLIIMILNIFPIMLDVSFIFFGNEDFGQIAFRSIIVKALIIVGILVFVKEKEDLWIYTLLNALNPFVSALVMLPFLRKYLVKIKLKEMKPLQHLIPSLRLFIPTIAISVYTILNRVIIGVLVEGEVSVIENGVAVIKRIADMENGYYEQSEKVVKMALAIITALGSIMISRNAGYFEKNELDKVKEKIYSSIKFVFFLGIPLMFGLVLISFNFSPWFFGPGFEKVPYLIVIFSPLALIVGLSNVFGEQYIVASGKDTPYTISVIVGAIVNLILNLILVSFLLSYGAAIATIIAEFSILLFQVIYLRKVFSWKKLLRLSIKYVISGIVMFVPIFFLSLNLEPSKINTLIIIVSGILLYGCCMIVSRDEFVMFVINKVFGKIKKKNS